LRQKVDSLLLALLPRRCALCGARAAGIELCAGCLEDMPWLAHCCPGCAIPQRQKGICAPCRATQFPSVLMLAALAYEYPVDRLIAALKYRNRQALAPLLGELLAIRVLTANVAIPWPTLVLPVPLHSARYRQRGFNQSELIAEALVAELNLAAGSESALTMERNYLQRVRTTRAQKTLGRRQRLENLAGAFCVSGPVAGRHVVLVDDVITTGATVTACCKALLDAGACEVSVLAVCRSL